MPRISKEKGCRALGLSIAQGGQHCAGLFSFQTVKGAGAHCAELQPFSAPFNPNWHGYCLVKSRQSQVRVLSHEITDIADTEM